MIKQVGEGLFNTFIVRNTPFHKILTSYKGEIAALKCRNLADTRKKLPCASMQEGSSVCIVISSYSQQLCSIKSLRPLIHEY